eukprot:SAG22_NODE_420_length_10739_cov_7.090320_9_plen_58_part_00
MHASPSADTDVASQLRQLDADTRWFGSYPGSQTSQRSPSGEYVPYVHASQRVPVVAG